ncbi:hypothetical protein Tco_0441195 [Tanacetum coccineum]
MDDPNITMEEYIRLEEEKARRRGKVYNWETATYGKIWDNEDVHDLRSVETEFPAIVFNDTLTSEATLSLTVGLSPDVVLDCFIVGLKAEIQRELAFLKPPTLDTAVGLAKLIEDKIKAEHIANAKTLATFSQN